MLTTIVLTAALVVGPGKKANKQVKIDTADVLYRMEQYIDTSCNEGERTMEMMHLNEKGMGRVHRDVRPTFYKSPFNRRKEIG